MAGTVLSQVLPHIVDHLTPGGQVPQGGLSGAGSSLLQSILGRIIRRRVIREQWVQDGNLLAVSGKILIYGR